MFFSSSFLQNTKILKNITPGETEIYFSHLLPWEHTWFSAPATAPLDLLRSSTNFMPWPCIPYAALMLFQKDHSEGYKVSPFLPNAGFLWWTTLAWELPIGLVEILDLCCSLIFFLPNAPSTSSPATWETCIVVWLFSHLLSSLHFILQGVSSNRSLAFPISLDICFLRS